MNQPVNLTRHIFVMTNGSTTKVNARQKRMRTWKKRTGRELGKHIKLEDDGQELGKHITLEDYCHELGKPQEDEMN